MHYYIYNKETDELTMTEDSDKWTQWFRHFPNRCLAQDLVDNWMVSTVVLGINHNWLENGDPILFETMVFDKIGKPLDEYTCRYSSSKDAMEGHKQICSLVENRA